MKTLTAKELFDRLRNPKKPPEDPDDNYKYQLIKMAQEPKPQVDLT